MSSWRDSLRFLQDGEYDPEFDTEIIVFGGGDDDIVADDDDGYLIPVWSFMLLMIVLAGLIVAAIFYFSYKHELCMRKDQRGNKRGEDDESMGEADLEKGKKLATKTFNDSNAFDRLPQHEFDQHMQSSQTKFDTGSSETTGTSTDGTAAAVANSTRTTGSGTTSSRATASTNSVLHSMVAAPRCVLCSKSYEIGENVTHSTACHHEYHEACLVKHWKKSKQLNAKCPVCKVEYVVEERAPSKHFSSHMSMNASGRRNSASERQLEPFEE